MTHFTVVTHLFQFVNQLNVVVNVCHPGFDFHPQFFDKARGMEQRRVKLLIGLDGAATSTCLDQPQQVVKLQC